MDPETPQRKTMIAESVATRLIQEDDIPSIARVHKAAYPPDHFTSRFSVKMLESMYLELWKVCQYSYVAVNSSGDIMGMILGDSGRKIIAAKNNFYKKNILAMTLASLRNPEFIKEIIVKKIFYKKNKKQSKALIRLVSIAVAPEYQRSNVGKVLMKVFEKALIDDNIYLYGTSAKASNTKVINFDKFHGMQEEYRDETGIYFIKDLSTPKSI